MLGALKDKGGKFACMFSKLFCKSVFPASEASPKSENSNLMSYFYSERSALSYAASAFI